MYDLGMMKFFWAILVGGWVLAAILRFYLAAIAWRRDRIQRFFSGCIFLFAGFYFSAKLQADHYSQILPYTDFLEVISNLLLAGWALIDSFLAIYGMATKRLGYVRRKIAQGKLREESWTP